MTTTMTVRGQTVIPASIRRAFGLMPHAKLEWVQDARCIRVTPVPKDAIGAARGALGTTGLNTALLKKRKADKHHEHNSRA